MYCASRALFVNGRGVAWNALRNSTVAQSLRTAREAGLYAA